MIVSKIVALKGTQFCFDAYAFWLHFSWALLDFESFCRGLIKISVWVEKKKESKRRAHKGASFHPCPKYRKGWYSTKEAGRLLLKSPQGIISGWEPSQDGSYMLRGWGRKPHISESERRGNPTGCFLSRWRGEPREVASARLLPSPASLSGTPQSA